MIRPINSVIDGIGPLILPLIGYSRQALDAYAPYSMQRAEGVSVFRPTGVCFLLKTQNFLPLQIWQESFSHHTSTTLPHSKFKSLIKREYQLVSRGQRQFHCLRLDRSLLHNQQLHQIGFQTHQVWNCLAVSLSREDKKSGRSCVCKKQAQNGIKRVKICNFR